MKPRALDLFCGAGGATRGLQMAGFHVTGIDNCPQPRYVGDSFVRGDALQPPIKLEEFDLIWASPPCQAYSIGNARWRYDYPDLIDETRALLHGQSITVIENVASAPLRADIVLTGLMFDLPLIRRRHFEISGFPAPFLLYRQTTGTVTNGDLACVAGHGANRAWNGGGHGNWSQLPLDLKERLSRRNNKAGWAEAMQIDWMLRDEMAEAIPPAYAEFIGRAILDYIGRKAA